MCFAKVGDGASGSLPLSPLRRASWATIGGNTCEQHENTAELGRAPPVGDFLPRTSKLENEEPQPDFEQPCTTRMTREQCGGSSADGWWAAPAHPPGVGQQMPAPGTGSM